MNEANRGVREAARDVVVEILGALGVPPQEMDSHFGEGSAGAAIELRLTRFAEAILEQAQPKPPAKASPERPGSPARQNARGRTTIRVSNGKRRIEYKMVTMSPPTDNLIGEHLLQDQQGKYEIDLPLASISSSLMPSRVIRAALAPTHPEPLFLLGVAKNWRLGQGQENDLFAGDGADVVV